MGQPTALSLAWLSCPGVIPVLVGPLQVLLAMLPYLLVALGGAVAAVFKPSALWKGAKLLWRVKFTVVIAAAVLGGGVYGIAWAWPASPSTVSEREAGSSDWSMFRCDAARRGWAGGDDCAGGGLNWSTRKLAPSLFSSPAVVGNRVYFTSATKEVFADQGAIYCVDADTGGLVWRFRPSGYRATFSSPAVAGGYLVCGEGLHFTTDARVICLKIDGDRPELLWEYRTASHVESSPCISGGRVYIGAGDDGYYCFDLKPASPGKPKVVWHLPGERYPDAETSPAVVADAGDGRERVFVGLGMGGRAVCCLDAETGRELWRVAAPYPVFTPPTVVEGKVYVGMGNGNFMESAEEVMEKELAKLRGRGATEAQLQGAAKTLGPAGEVWCIEAASGQVQWRCKLPRTVLGAVAAGKEALYCGSRDGGVYAVSYGGQVTGRWDTHSPILASPAVGSAHVYVVCGDGKLLALSAASLQPAWMTVIGMEGNFVSSPVLARGWLYVGTPGDGVVCLGTGRRSRPIWAGRLGGPGRGGTIDTGPLPRTGDFIWQYPPDEAGGGEAGKAKLSIAAPAACLGQRLFVGVRGGQVRGLVCLKHDAKGREAPGPLWRFETPNGVALSPAAVDENVLVCDGLPGQSGRRLYCLSAGDGKARWEAPVASEASGRFVVAAAAGADQPAPGWEVFVADGAGVLSCLDSSGGTRWTQRLGDVVDVPDVAESIVVVALQPTGPPATRPAASGPAVGGELAVLDRPTGIVLWRRRLEAACRTGPVLRNNVIFVGTDKGLTACRLADGAELLAPTGAGGVAEGFVLDEGRAAYVSTDGKLVLLRIARDPAAGETTGRLVADVQAAVAGASPAAGLLLTRDAVIYDTGRGALMRLTLDDPASQPKAWMDVSWVGTLTAAMIKADSRVYFATDTMGLVCAGKWR